MNTHQKSKMQTQQFVLLKIFSLLFCDISPGYFLLWCLQTVESVLIDLQGHPSFYKSFVNPAFSGLLDHLKISHLLMIRVCTKLSMETPHTYEDCISQHERQTPRRPEVRIRVLGAESWVARSDGSLASSALTDHPSSRGQAWSHRRPECKSGFHHGDQAV